MRRASLLLVYAALTMGGCTYATMRLEDGTRLSYFDFHPGGNAVATEGIWENVGSFQIDRKSADSSEFAGEVAEGIIDGVIPN